MKRVISLALSIILVALCFSGCAHADYKKYDSTGERYDCYLPDYIDVAKYTGLEVPNLVYSVTNEMLQKKLDRDRSVFSPDEYDPDRGARYCDTADIVTECYVDGEIYDLFTFELDYRDQGHSVVVGCNELDVPAIDDALMGMRQGETKTITFNFPDPFYRSLKMSGKEATITITMNALYGIELVEETDEFFHEHYGYSINEYRAFCTKNMEEQYNGFIEDYKSDIVWEYIYENSEVKEYPEEYENLYDETLEAYRKAAKDKGTNLVNYVTETLKYEDLDAFYEFLEEYVKDTCKREMILYYIARSENLNYTQEYYEQEILEYAEGFEIKELEEAESFVDYMYGLDAFKERIRLNYVYEWLGNNATVREDITTYVNDLNK